MLAESQRQSGLADVGTEETLVKVLEPSISTDPTKRQARGQRKMDLLEPWRNAPPARYAIESDSEDEVDPEDTDRAAGHVAASTSTRTRGKDDVELKRISDASIKADDLIVAVDRAGQIWAEGFQEEQQQDITSSASLREDAVVLVASRKVASLSAFSQHSTTIAFVAGVSSYEAMHTVSRALIDSVQPSRITIVDSYGTSSYLPSRSSPSIRYLATTAYTPSSNVAQLDTYDPPNIVAGLGAALASLAQERGMPCLLLLLPSSNAGLPSTGLLARETQSRPVPEAIYDFGGSPAHEDASLLTASGTAKILHGLAKELGWEAIGWHLKQMLANLERSPSSSRARRERSRSKGQGDQAGFTWLQAEKRAVGAREIGEGGMYM